MDSAYIYQRDDFDDDDDHAIEAPPPVIGSERRMHVRAYEYWLSLLRGRPCPSIQDLDPSSISDFGPNSVLLDFSRSVGDPTVTYLGRALREECGMLHGIRQVSDVPPRSLLSRLTDHYLQIIANRTPVGFEAEFINQQGLPTRYRGILMPFSSNGDTIDYVYGVINWKHGASAELAGELERQVAGILGGGPLATDSVSPWPEAESVEAAETTAEPAADAGLRDWLAAARISAEEARRCDGRAHSALYAAIGRAYDFSLTADAYPDQYAELLSSEGLSVQDRAPMTPIVKLVFGLAHDKTRLTEYAAALSFARDRNVGRGELATLLESFEGGLKGVVRAERARRAPAAPKADRTEQARTALRAAAPRLVVEIETGEDEFVLLVARRDAAGRVAILASLTDAALVDQAVRKAAA